MLHVVWMSCTQGSSISFPPPPSHFLMCRRQGESSAVLRGIPGAVRLELMEEANPSGVNLSPAGKCFSPAEAGLSTSACAARRRWSLWSVHAGSLQLHKDDVHVSDLIQTPSAAAAGRAVDISFDYDGKLQFASNERVDSAWMFSVHLRSTFTM